jgi:hypothetical protein
LRLVPSCVDLEKTGIHNYYKQCLQVRPSAIASQAYGLPKQRGFMSKMASKVKQVLAFDDPMYRQPLEVSEPFPIVNTVPQTQPFFVNTMPQ